MHIVHYFLNKNDQNVKNLVDIYSLNFILTLHEMLIDLELFWGGAMQWMELK